MLYKWASFGMGRLNLKKVIVFIAVIGLIVNSSFITPRLVSASEEKLSNTGFETNLTGWDSDIYIEEVKNTQSANLIGYWPLNESSGTVADNAEGTAARDGAISGATLGQDGIGDGQTSFLFDGVNDDVNAYSTSLRDVFNKDAGSSSFWAKVSDSSVLNDGVGRWATQFSVSSDNRTEALKSSLGNMNMDYFGGGLFKGVSSAMSTGWSHFAYTWDTTGDEIELFIDGVSAGTQTGLGTWVGTIVKANIGSFGGGGYWDGYLAHVAVWDTPLTGPQIANLATVPLSRDTSRTYFGAASAKLVATADSTFTQSVNVGSTDTYNLEAYAYTPGGGVPDSSSVALYANGSTINTTYDAAGGGWYKLSGSVTGVSSAQDYGVQVKAGKTVYVDSFSLKSTVPDPVTKTTDSSGTNANVHEGYIYEVNAGPSYIGTSSFIMDNQGIGAGALITNEAHSIDLNVQLNQTYFDSLTSLAIPPPWIQGFNTYSEIFSISAVSAFNGFSVTETNSPYTLMLPIDTTRLDGIPLTSLKIAHFKPSTNTWNLLPTSNVFNTTTSTIANTTSDFGYFVVVHSKGGTTTSISTSLVLGEAIAPSPIPTPISSPSPTPVATPSPSPSPEPTPLEVPSPSSEGTPSAVIIQSALSDWWNHIVALYVKTAKGMEQMGIAMVYGSVNTTNAFLSSVGYTATKGVGLLASVRRATTKVATNIAETAETITKELAINADNTTEAVLGAASEKAGTISDKLHEVRNSLAAKLEITYVAWFSKEPTQITEVKVAEIGNDYAIISWETNHYTNNNKINYGEDLSYGLDAFGSDLRKEHVVKISNLKPATKYVFEVMSQSHNYVYDSHHEFTTSSE